MCGGAVFIVHWYKEAFVEERVKPASSAEIDAASLKAASRPIEEDVLYRVTSGDVA